MSHPIQINHCSLHLIALVPIIHMTLHMVRSFAALHITPAHQHSGALGLPEVRPSRWSRLHRLACQLLVGIKSPTSLLPAQALLSEA
jgi:hypothetical protein